MPCIAVLWFAVPECELFYDRDCAFIVILLPGVIKMLDMCRSSIYVSMNE